MFQHQELKNYELFTIQIDKSVEYVVEKVTINQKECQEFFNLFEGQEDIQVTGLYGDYYEILKKLKENFNGRQLLNSNVDKGKIFGIKNFNQMIFLLTFPEKFFLQKPLDEKSIKITLFRILFDLVKNIHLCLRKEVFEQWYEGECVPFSHINIFRRQAYIIDSSLNKNVVEKYLNLEIFGKAEQNFQFQYQNRGSEAFFYQINKIEKSSIKKIFDEQFQTITNNIIKKFYDKQEILIEEEIKLLSQCFLDSEQEDKLRYQLNSLIIELKKVITDKELAKKVKELFKKDITFSDKLIFKVQYCKFKSLRQSDHMDNSVQSSHLEIQKEITTQQLDLKKAPKYLVLSEIVIPIFTISFRTKEDHELYLFFDSNSKNLVIYIKPQLLNNWTKLSTICNTSEKCVLYFNERDNELYIFNAENFKIVYKIEFKDKEISNQYNFCCQMENLEVDQVAHLSQTKQLLIFSNKKQFFVLGEIERKFEPQNIFKDKQFINTNKYVQLLSCPSGKYFYFSDQIKCDMFDCNFCLIKEIQIKGQLKVISDNCDVFILNYPQNRQLYVLTNVIDKSSLTKVKNEEIKIEGNPSIDIIKGASIKFGPVSSFLSYQMNDKVQFYTDNQEQQKKISNYLKQISLYEFDVEQNSGIKFNKEKLSQLKGIFYSRVPLQLCTIESSNFVPLVNGFRKQQKKKQISIEEKTKELYLGHLEHFLKGLKEKVFVVCIIGKQSSGKSYLLNRIFGTRYSVAACRCTDGVWASFARIENINYLIFDCEGLFSSARSQKEEVQMLAFLTALSDVTLLNQDLTFNRFLADLLDKLSEATEQLAGDTLFKGTLTFVLRDISTNDNKGVEEELITNINKSKSKEKQEVVYLKKLFNNQFDVQLLLNYENKNFDQQIIIFRNEFIKQSKITNRWQNGEQLIQQMKILLCQLETSDKSNATLLQQQMQVRQTISNQKLEWKKFILKMNKDPKILSQQNDEDQQEFDNLDISDIKIRKQLNLDFRQMITKSFGLSNKTVNHNENLEKIDQELQKILLEKFNKIQINLDSQLKELNNGIEIQKFINQDRSNLTDILQKQISNFKFCKQKCSKCSLNCSNFLIHDLESKTQLNELREKIKNLEQNIIIYDIECQNIYKTKITDQIMTNIRKDLEFFEDRISTHNSKLKQFELKKQMDIENENNQKIQQDLDEFFQNNLEVIKDLLQNLRAPQSQNDFESDSIQIEEKKLQQLKELKNEILIKRADLEIYVNSLQQKIKQNCQKFQDYKTKEEKTQETLQNLLNEKVILQTQLDKLNGSVINRKQVLQKLMGENKNVEISKINDVYIDNIDALLGQKQRFFFNIREKENELQIWRNQSVEFLNLRQETNIFINLYQQKKKYLEQIEIQILELKNKKNTIEVQIIKIPKNQKFQDEKNKLTSQLEQLDKVIQELDQEYEKNQIPQLEIIQDLIQEEHFTNQQVIEKFLEKNSEKENHIINEISKLKAQQLELEFQIDQVTNRQRFKQGKQDLSKKMEEVQNSNEKLNQIEEKSKTLEQELKALQNELHQLKLIESQQLKTNQELNSQLKEINQKVQRLDSAIEKYPQYIEKIAKFQESKMSELEIQKQLSHFVVEKISSRIEKIDIEQQITNISKEISDLQQERDKIKLKIEIYEKLEQSKSELRELNQQIQIIEKNKEDHSCLRENHQCDEYCISCPTIKCKFTAGHTGEHLCTKPDHACEVQCQVQNCNYQCSFVRNHPGQHFCKNFHQCEQICQHCPKKCQTDRNQIHKEHFCKETKCNKNCCLCDSGCKQNHSHSKQKSETHFCDKKDHRCVGKCQSPGICKIHYEQIDSEWKTGLSTFTYTYYRQIEAGKQDCISRVPQGCGRHYGNHICIVETDKQFHSCTNRCPECDAFCTKKFGHTDVHSTHQHRNKEKQLFTLAVGEYQKIIIDETRIFWVGESAKPETCQESCQRRGRSHFHLIECKGRASCLEQNREYQKYARHSKKKYQGYENKKFDEVMCCYFWQINKWSHPCSTAQCEEIQKCNYYCAECGDNDKKFCVKSAWHKISDKKYDHEFICQELHSKYQVKGLQVCFVIDSTGSMQKYLTESIEVIQRIMKESQNFKVEDKYVPVEFSVIAYNDHPVPFKNSEVVKFQDFSNESTCVYFLKKITADGGGDGPEAVLDGLQQTIKLKWNFDNTYQKIMYLIADAPPHGKNKESENIYHNYGDDYPDGCPCGLTQKPILNDIKRMNIKFKILKLNDCLNMTISEFQKDFKELEILDIKNNTNQFVDVMVRDVCSVLKQTEITY